MAGGPQGSYWAEFLGRNTNGFQGGSSKGFPKAWDLAGWWDTLGDLGILAHFGVN